MLITPGDPVVTEDEKALSAPFAIGNYTKDAAGARCPQETAANCS
jgi:hypothetical protein